MRKTLMAAALVLITAAAFGQGQPPARGDAGISPERMEMLKLWRIIDELEIEEEQAAELFPYWSKHQRDKRELVGERLQATRALHHLLMEEGVSDADIEKQIDEIRGIDRRVEEQESEFRDGLEKRLSVRQQARLIVFEQRFRGDLRDMVRGFRGMRRGWEGRGNGGGWGQMPE